MIDNVIKANLNYFFERIEDYYIFLEDPMQ